MHRISVGRKDIAWNYIGTILSMTSGFILLPFLLLYLSKDELGLWYIYIAIANMTLLFEFGFNPTFARNIVYCLSGAQRIKRKGIDFSIVDEPTNWHLLKTLLKTSRLIYAIISIGTFILVVSIGSIYVSYITRDISGQNHWIAWIIFCVSMFLNLYFNYYITYLRGFGDIAGENKAKGFSKILQLVLSILLLILGIGLVGAAVGYLASGLGLRVFAKLQLRKHSEIWEGLQSDCAPVKKEEIKQVFASVSFAAWRDGVVQLSRYASSQATSIICSLFLSLSETGTYSIMLQLATAIGGLAGAYVRAHYPRFQSAYASNDVCEQIAIAERGIVAYLALFVLGAIGVRVAVMPILPLLNPNLVIDMRVFWAVALYMLFFDQHSICCNFIISMNEIPYVTGYLVAALLGVVFSVIMISWFGLGIWGLLVGQLLSQALYNNWRWPYYLTRKLGTSYFRLLRNGASWWRRQILH